MKTLSIWKPVYNGLRWAGNGLRSFWRASKFEVFPTEKNLLTSLWYDYAHFRRVCPKETVYDFMDQWKQYLEVKAEPGSKTKPGAQLAGTLLQALNRGNVRQCLITYLESSSPEEHYRPLLEAVRSAWRPRDEEKPESGHRLAPGKKAPSVDSDPFSRL